MCQHFPLVSYSTDMDKEQRIKQELCTEEEEEEEEVRRGGVKGKGRKKNAKIVFKPIASDIVIWARSSNFCCAVRGEKFASSIPKIFLLDPFFFLRNWGPISKI